MRAQERFDVLVVGARCAGAATAMLMARHGLKVLAVDRGAHGTDTLSTHALMRGAVLQLHRWGLLPRIVEMGTPAVRSTSFHYGDEVLEVDIRPSHGVDALYAPRRTVLDSLLADAAWEAGVDLRYGHTLMELTHSPDGRVNGAVLLDETGRLMGIQADLVIGADGIGSTVARLAGAPVVKEGRHATSVVYGYWAGIGTTGYHWHYREGVSAGAIPTNGGQHCIFASMRPARFRDEIRHDVAAGYRRILAELSPDLAEAVAGARLDGRLWAFAGRKGFVRRSFGPGWALVGDAAYFKDPLTAHGITDALRDAELVARAALQGTEAALEEFVAIRDRLSQPFFEVTEAIASFDWDLEGVKGLHQMLNKAMKPEAEYLAALQDTLPGPGVTPAAWAA